MPNFNGDVVFVDSSGQVRSQSGDLTLRADSTNIRDVIVGSGRSLRPDIHCAIDLGREELRWETLYACSGNFQDRPSVNGSGVLLQGEVDFIANGSVALNILPAYGTDFVLIHGLGTADWTWGMWRTDVTPYKAVIPHDIFPSGVNGVRIQLDSVMTGRVVLTSCGASGVATGAVGMFQTEIDFGSDPIEQSGFLIVNSSVASGAILIGGVAYASTSDKDLDELELDALDLKLGESLNGGFTILATSLLGPVVGKFKINYSVTNI